MEMQYNEVIKGMKEVLGAERYGVYKGNKLTTYVGVSKV